MNRDLLQDLLAALSTAFRTRDVKRLLGLFSATDGLTYVGSGAGEKAVGPRALRRLLSELLSRPVAYSFEFDDLIFCEDSGRVWMFTDGQVIEIDDCGSTTAFPYQITGVLVQEEGQWRWLVLVGAQPANVVEGEPFGEALPPTPGHVAIPGPSARVVLDLLQAAS